MHPARIYRIAALPMAPYLTTQFESMKSLSTTSYLYLQICSTDFQEIAIKILTIPTIIIGSKFILRFPNLFNALSSKNVHYFEIQTIMADHSHLASTDHASFHHPIPDKAPLALLDREWIRSLSSPWLSLSLCPVQPSCLVQRLNYSPLVLFWFKLSLKKLQIIYVYT